MWNAIILVQDWTRVVVSISYDDNHYTTGMRRLSTQQLKVTYTSKKMSRDVEFFPASIILVHWVYAPLSLGGVPESGARKFSLLTSSWLVFYLRLHPITSCYQLSKGHELSSSLSHIVSGVETSISTRACARDFGLPVFLRHFQLCYSATTAGFIYLCIYSFIYSFIQFQINCSKALLRDRTLNTFATMSQSSTLTTAPRGFLSVTKDTLFHNYCTSISKQQATSFSYLVTSSTIFDVERVFSWNLKEKHGYKQFAWI